MRTFFSLLKTELKLNIRNMNMVIFAVIMPAVVLVILGFIYQKKPAFPGAEYTFLEQSMSAVCTISICAGGLMGLPLVVAGYRERKILKRFRVTPISPAAFFGSWLLTLVSTLSIGMMVGGIAKNEKMASVIACLLYFPMLIFSGATLPFEVMPEMMQKIVALFPLAQGIQLMKAAFLGMHTESVWVPAAVMGIVTILCAGAAVKFFKWE